MSNFKQYYEMALRIKDKTPTYLYTRPQRNEILDAYSQLKSGLTKFGFHINREPENEFFGNMGNERVHGKLFKAEINVNGTAEHERIKDLTSELRKLETKFPKLDFDFEFALIQKTNICAWNLSIFPEKILNKKTKKKK